MLALAVLVARLAPARGVDPIRAAAFVALNPLVLVHVVGGAHNDSLAVLLTMLGVAGILVAREISAGAAFAAAIAVKASALVTVPFALAASLRPTGRYVKAALTYRPVGGLLGGMALAVAGIGLVAYLAFGWNWLDAFALAGENQGRTSHMSIPITRPGSPASTPTRPAPPPSSSTRALVAYLLAWTAAAATGSAPPPGPPRASSWPQPGSSPGTSSGPSPSQPSPATVPSSSWSSA